MSTPPSPAPTDVRGEASPPDGPELGGLGALGTRSRSWGIAATYAVFASCWIYFSDRALGWFIDDPEGLVRWSVWKGTGFVVLTTLLLLKLMRRTFGAVEAGYASTRALARKLRASEERLNSIINSALDAIVTMDETRRIVGFNAAAERTFGCPASAALGELLERFIPGWFEHGGEANAVLRGRRLDGTEFPIEASLTRFEFGERHHLAAILRDISQREAADRERQFSETMIESMPGVVYLYDEKLRFLRWNRNFLTLTGYSAEEIARMQPLDFFADADRAVVQQRIGEVFTRGEASVEAPFRSRDGSLRPYYFTGRRVIFDGSVCVVGVGIDISERKQAEEALRLFNDGLELQVAERTSDLHKALVRAESAGRIKSAFLATMSHELRTPLNSIIGFTGIVLQELAGPLNPEQAKQLGMVRGSARHLLELINDVLDLSKIESGQLEVRSEPFDLAASVERVTASVRPLAERKGLTLSVLAPTTIGRMIGDRRRLEQILINLLNNGIKFTERGGVTLTAEPGTRIHPSGDDAVDPVVVFRIADTGIGIQAEDMATLFQPFRLIDSGLSRQHEGTGLGLAICRRLATLMGGDICVTSEWSKGSVFTVTLPLNPP